MADDAKVVAYKQPSHAEAVAELLAAAGGRLTEEELTEIGIGLLHFYYRILTGGAQVKIKLPSGTVCDFDLQIPGLLEAR